MCPGPFLLSASECRRRPAEVLEPPAKDRLSACRQFSTELPEGEGRLIVLGEGNGTQRFDPHARMALGRRIRAQPATARFKRMGQPYLSVQLDDIMVSPDLVPRARWQIRHPFDHPENYADEGLRNALLTASDHFFVVPDLADRDQPTRPPIKTD